MDAEPTREEVDRSTGPWVLEFGAAWCPICQGTRPLIDRALADHPGIRYARIEDGKGKPLGRSFRVKLWPTLVFVRDGQELSRLVRPTSDSELRLAFENLSATPTP
ncbi:MAG TPA: thioredoxin family protein [Polyangiaceae bacterium]|nr:thioredoxin family protein [Polyangiaceae bacterium]